MPVSFSTTLFDWHRVWFHNSEYLDLMDHNYTVRCCTTYDVRVCICTYLPRISAAAVLRSYPAIAAAAVLLLAAAVRHRVPDD